MTARRHLVLVGIMGSGKTVVGEACAARLSRPFVDTDALVEAEAGMPVVEIFATEGEESFRHRERRTVAGVCESPEPLVVACGGGVVLDPGNRRRLGEAGVVVWLTADPGVLGARVGDGEGRPLLAGSPPAEALARLAELRRPAYEAVADAVVDTSAFDVAGATDAVLAAAETARPGFSRREAAPVVEGPGQGGEEERE